MTRQSVYHGRTAKVFLLPVLAAAAFATTARAADDLAPALSVLTGDSIKSRLTVLASDEFEGRAPATPGEEKTVAYLAAEMRKIGLQPANPSGSWFQDVPMVGIASKVATRIVARSTTLEPVPTTDYVALTRRVTERIELKDTPVVFVGYGIEAPEYGWDDYKGVDVRGKTVVMLIGDPPVPDPKDAAKLDETVFRGKAMTYYGRWTYKYEIASAKGAAACLIVHETGPAGYPFAVVGGSWGREDFDLRTADGNRGRVPVEGWMTLEFSQKLFAAAGQDFATLKKAAVGRNFRPVAFDAKASFTVTAKCREVVSRNVVGVLPGSDPKLKNEYVVYSTHWDHLGRDTSLKGDQIFNGANDNAAGCAMILAVAQAFKALPVAPKRTLIFAFVTAEEKGLLGSKYYAEHPFFPAARTLADITVDGANLLGRTSDVEIIGYGNSTIDDVATAIAQAEGRAVVPDTSTEKGYFYRSDHFEFARVGVPAFYPKAGKSYVGKPAAWGQQQADLYLTRDYHKVTDEIKPDWTYDGAVQEAAFVLKVGHAIAQGDRWPEWKPGSEFKARRDAMLKAAK